MHSRKSDTLKIHYVTLPLPDSHKNRCTRTIRTGFRQVQNMTPYRLRVRIHFFYLQKKCVTNDAYIVGRHWLGTTTSDGDSIQPLRYLLYPVYATERFSLHFISIMYSFNSLKTPFMMWIIITADKNSYNKCQVLVIRCGRLPNEEDFTRSLLRNSPRLWARTCTHVDTGEPA